MKIVLSIGLTLVLVLVPSCAMKKDPEGLSVRIKVEGDDILKKELRSFLTSKGFRTIEENSGSTLIFIRDRPGESPTMIAMFSHGATGYSFVIGKITKNFTEAEVAIVDGCAAVIVAHADSVISGSALKEATTSVSREKFYTKIRKEA